MDFRGASAEAVAVLTDELKTSVSGSGNVPATADSLFSASRTLRAEPALRRFATDPTLPGEAKTGLVKEVFGSHLDPAALTVLSSAVSRRWTHSADLADGVERLAETAHVLSAGDASGRLSDELFALRRTIEDNPALREALSDPARTEADKAGLVDDLLDGKALPATVALAKQALAGTYGTVSAALREYRTLAAEVHGQRVATVHTAAPLSDEQTTRLVTILSRQYGRPVHANVVVDRALIGGLRVEIGDEVIDGTVASRLEDAGRGLAG